jgi:serine/threonine protein kinase/lipoprotein NlpI
VLDVPRQLQTALVDRYTIEGELGRGGMGVVYRAWDVKHARPVALKVVRSELGSVLAAERFLREIQLAAKLQHPHIVPLYDSGDAAGALFYVMPLVEGESLRSRLQRERQLPLEDALQITREAADALGYAHSHDVVHRDIKPENILLAGGHALVVDFGIGRAITAAGGDRLTESGISVGTPAYMSPEQVAGDAHVDGRSDIYSLGCVLYEMLAGHPPFLGATAQEVLARHTLDPVPSLRTARPGVSVGVEDAIEKALAKVAADRFGTAAKFSEALSAAPVPRRRGVKLGGSIVATLLALTLGWWLATRPRSHASELKSIAVLPCDNATRDTAKEYVGDRWTEELIDKLFRVGDLQPKSWLSVQHYRATPKTSQEIASEVGAKALVRCRVTEGAAGVRLAVQLIRADNDQVMWSNEYERALSAEAINAVQTEAARGIAGALGSVPSTSERARLDRPLSRDLEALKLYRLGRHSVGLLTVGALQRSLEYYRQAIARDSTFAYAYVGLAEAITIVKEAELRPGREYYPEVARLVLKAMDIDGTIAEAHSSLAAYLLYYAYDWPSAEREHRRALELNPSSAQSRIWYGFDLASVAHFDAAIAQVEKAVELDPAYPFARVQLVQILYLARQDSRALVEARAALELDPNNPALHLLMGRILRDRGHPDSGIAEFEKGLQLQTDGGFAAVRAELGYTYGIAGRQERTRQALEELTRLSARQPVDPTAFSMLYIALGKKDEAMRLLQQAYQERSELLVGVLGTDRAFDSLRDDPRFQALRKQVGLDQW